QSPLAHEAAKLFCKLTGHARVAFCNTGSEAVMAAMRVARTVTCRDRIVAFSGAYHGQFDEVLVRGVGEQHRSVPAAPGIPAEAVGR
uniref:aminotransferase class III-fold pyridoxal phosphate-dependent enzyme n=1 Tax=Streptomyces niveiscabiei TaxID=164115 RepID=UPI0038F5EDCE